MIGICLSMTDLDLFFNSSRNDAMATDFMAKFGYMRSLGNSDVKIFNSDILATFCAKMMKIGPATPVITRVINAPFWVRRQKSAYLACNHCLSVMCVLEIRLRANLKWQSNKSRAALSTEGEQHKRCWTRGALNESRSSSNVSWAFSRESLSTASFRSSQRADH